jgi:mannose-6-phosphate isomerase-like protein (cupin superfamily)
VNKESPLTIDFPPSGESFVFHSSFRGPEKMFRLTWSLAPGKEGPGEHIHPKESHFTRVVSGEIAVFLDGVRHDCRAGDGLTIGPGVAHRFKNFGDVPVVIEVANDGPSMEDFLVPLAVELRRRDNKMSMLKATAIMLVQLVATDPTIPVGKTVWAARILRPFAWLFKKLGVESLPPVIGWDRGEVSSPSGVVCEGGLAH